VKNKTLRDSFLEVKFEFKNLFMLICDALYFEKVVKKLAGLIGLIKRR